MPRIAVVLPVRNGEKYLKSAIESILVQSFSDFSLVVVDDGSTDMSPHIVSKFVETDSRVSLVQTEGVGGALARNIGIGTIDSEYIAAMDADDISLPARLELQYNRMRMDNSLLVTGTHIEFFGQKKGKPRMLVTQKECRKALCLFSPLAHPTVMLRRKQFHEVGGYSALYANDYSLFSQLSFLGNLENIPSVLLRYNIHSEQVSQAKQTEQIQFMLETLVNHHKRILKSDKLSKPHLVARLLRTAISLGPLHMRQSLRALRFCLRALDGGQR